MFRQLVKIEAFDKIVQKNPEAFAKDLPECGKQNHKSGVKCGICFDEFCTEDAGKIYATKCGHIFHRKCIENWFKRHVVFICLFKTCKINNDFFLFFSGSNANMCPHCTLVELFMDICRDTYCNNVNEEPSLSIVPKLFFEKSCDISELITIKFGGRGTLLEGKSAIFEEEIIIIMKNGRDLSFLELFSPYIV